MEDDRIVAQPQQSQAFPARRLLPGAGRAGGCEAVQAAAPGPGQVVEGRDRQVRMRTWAECGCGRSATGLRAAGVHRSDPHRGGGTGETGSSGSRSRTQRG